MANKGGNSTGGRRSALPDPMVPADCDLRDLPAIMLERTLPTSSLAALATAEEFRGAILLYFASYDELPAGSLPDDPLILSRKAGLTARQWTKAQKVVLRGWVKCNDGRYYHPITCEKVLIAWIARLKKSLSGSAGNAARWGGGTSKTDKALALTNAMNALATLNPESPSLRIPSRSQSDRSAIAAGSQVEGEGEGEAVEKSPSHKGADVIVMGEARA